MSNIGIGLKYWLPQTLFSVDVTTRVVVEVDERGSWPKNVTDVRIAPTTVQDPMSWHALSIDAGVLERISLTINLDDRGFIQSVNSESARDISPVVNIVGKLVGTALPLLTLLGIDAGAATAAAAEQAGPPPQPLEAQWSSEHELLAGAAQALQQQVQMLLGRLGSEQEPRRIVACSAALDQVQSHLATISQAKRAWIAGHARTLRTENWRLTPAELLQVDGVQLPALLHAPSVPPASSAMAEDCGVLLAIADPQRAQHAEPAVRPKTDELALRRSRPVSVGAYLRSENDPQQWRLDSQSVLAMDVVDRFSATDILPLDGSWWKTKSFELSYHPDMSLKTFGLATTSTASAVATSLGSALDGVAAAATHLAQRPSAADRELDAATTQLNLLKVANEHEVLAATRQRATELALLEQQQKLRALGAG